MRATGRSHLTIRRGGHPWSGLLAVLVALSLLAATTPAAAQGTPVASPATGGVQTVNGVLDSALGLGGDATLLGTLTDLSAWFEGDLSRPLPAEGQVIVPLGGTFGGIGFTLPLPARPLGQLRGFDQSAGAVQVFAANVQADLGGSPFLEPWEFTGWPTGYSSLTVATGTWAVTGGQVLVWADTGGGAFPSAPGPDGRPLTADDPVGPVEPGWTVVDLGQTPYALGRDATATVPVVTGFGGTRDLSTLGFTDAFDGLIADLRLRYPFTDLKGIDWDAIVATYRPAVVAADESGDLIAFQAAMMRLAVEIGDGHLAVTPSYTVLREQWGGSVGLTLGETTRGVVIVAAVADGSPADRAGVRPGSTVSLWDGRQPSDAVAEVEVARPVSSEQARRDQQLELLPRGPIGSEVEVAVRREGDVSATTITLDRTEDDQGVFRLLGRDRETLAARAGPIVDSRMLDDRTGYIAIRSFARSPALTVAAWDRALLDIQTAGARGLVLDLRGNPGGVLAVANYVAGAFLPNAVNIASLRIATDGGALAESGFLTVRPSAVQWEGDLSVLVDAGCLSACETLAGTLAGDPRVDIVGESATAGVVATVSFWQLPGALQFQAPLGRFERDGQVWLEGTGVAPTVVVPVTRASLLSPADEVLDAGVASFGQ